MRRAFRHPQIVRAAGIVLMGLLLVVSPSCTKKVKPAQPAPVEEPPPTEATPPTPPAEVEKPLPPVTEPKEKAEDIDDIIRTQNATRQYVKTVYFDFDKSDIRDDQVPVLKANAAWLKTHAQYKLLVEGHCDERDTIEYNLALGDRRAKSVRQYLIDLGIPAERMRTISYGEERPADPGHDEAAWAKNRRAEFTLEK